jgi:hypothetical protein
LDLKTFDTRKAAEAWLVEAQGEVSRGVHTPERASVTIAEAADIWLESGKLENLERSTLAGCRCHVEQHIKPSRIGNEKLARLSTPAVEACCDDLLKKSSRANARKVLTSLKSILGEAQWRGLVAHNAAQPVKIDAKKRDRSKLAAGRDIPSKEEVQTMLARAAGRWHPFFITAVFTGMRASELRGLTWDDVDFERKVVSARTCGARWGAQVGSRPPRDPDGTNGCQRALGMETRLPEGKARSRLPQRRRQYRTARQHRHPQLRATATGRARRG